MGSKHDVREPPHSQTSYRPVQPCSPIALGRSLSSAHRGPLPHATREQHGTPIPPCHTHILSCHIPATPHSHIHASTFWVPGWNVG